MKAKKIRLYCSMKCGDVQCGGKVFDARKKAAQRRKGAERSAESRRKRFGFLIIGEMADNQPRMQTLEFFQTLAETASGRFLMLDALY